MKYIISLLIISFLLSCSHQKEKAVRKSLFMPKASEIQGNQPFKKTEKKIEKTKKKRYKKK